MMSVTFMELIGTKGLAQDKASSISVSSWAIEQLKYLKKWKYSLHLWCDTHITCICYNSSCLLIAVFQLSS